MKKKTLKQKERTLTQELDDHIDELYEDINREKRITDVFYNGMQYAKVSLFAGACIGFSALLAGFTTLATTILLISMVFAYLSVTMVKKK